MTVGRLKASVIAKIERAERDRFMFDGAEDDGREVVNERHSVERVDALANIRALMRRAEESRARELDAVVSGERVHPDAPHPEPAWRRRSRVVFQRMVADLYLHVAPWHHHEIWLWAASSSAGTDWVESEIRYWETRLAREEARKRAIREQLLSLPLGEPVDDDEVE